MVTNKPLCLKCKKIHDIANKIQKLREVTTFAMGITSAYNVSDNQFREFIITNKLFDINKKNNIKSKLILINDTLDPFTERYFKRLLKYDKNLKKFKTFIGQPIFQIPCPYNSSKSLGEFFQMQLIKKLKVININPKIIQTHKSNHTKYYKRIRQKILENEIKIKNSIKRKFNLKLKTLYRPICKSCRRIDTTSLDYKNKTYTCIFCNKTFKFTKIPKGKFIWVVDCALRWACNKVDFEAFTPNYLQPYGGSYYVSSYIMKNYIREKIPLTFKFTYYKYNPRFKNLILSFPFRLIEKIFIKNVNNPNFPKDEQIINYAKKYLYGKFSLYHISYLIYTFYPNLKFNIKNFKKYNDIFFGIDNPNYNLIDKKIKIAYNFANKFIKNKIKLNSFKDMPIDKLSIRELRNIIKIFENKKIELKYIKKIYLLLFSTNFGPSIKIIKQILTDNYKKELIKYINYAIKKSSI